MYLRTCIVSSMCIIFESLVSSFPQGDFHSVALLEFMLVCLFIVSEWAPLSNEFLLLVRLESAHSLI